MTQDIAQRFLLSTFLIAVAITAWLAFFGRTASADTHAERCDVEQAQPARVGSAVPHGGAADAQGPSQ